MYKNRILNMFVIVLCAVVATGCARIKSLPPLDEKADAEECAVLIIPANAKVKRIDGAKRGLFSSWGAAFSVATLLVPAGDHAIVFECDNSQDGWAAKNLKCTVEMGAGKMYMISVELDKKTGGGKFLTVINEAASFVRDQLIDLIPAVQLMPRPNPEGIVYQISEIDQTVFDQYLYAKTVAGKKTIGEILLILLAGFLWLVILTLFRALGYLLFMGKFASRHKIASLILSISLLVVGVLLFNYNSSGVLVIYLTATFLMGFALSKLDFGISSAESGAEKLNKKDYAGAVSDYTEAITKAPFSAKYFNQRAFACYSLQEWEKAIADLTEAVRLAPNNVAYSKSLAEAKAAAAQAGIDSPPVLYDAEAEGRSQAMRRDKNRKTIGVLLGLVPLIAGIVLLYHHIHDTAQSTDIVNIGNIQIGALVVFGITGIFALVGDSNTRGASAGVSGFITAIIGFVGGIKYSAINVGSLSVTNVLVVIIFGVIGAVAGLIIGAIFGFIHRRIGGFAAGFILGIALLFLLQPFNPNVIAGKIAIIDERIARETKDIEQGARELDTLYQWRGHSYMSRGELSKRKNDFDHAAVDYEMAMKNSPYDVRTNRYRDLWRKARRKSAKAKN
jgi:tetratricopeptide (TPR) repeat protein